MSAPNQVISFLKWLMEFPSVTPDDKGLLEQLRRIFQQEQFQTQLLVFGDTKNLYVRWGQELPHLCFAGHIDVVPAGNLGAWKYDPFQGTQDGDYFYGRGVADMKGAVACYVMALLRFLKNNSFKGSCSILLTSDEEGPALDGLQKVLPVLCNQGQQFSHFLIGEPTGNNLGDVIQIGRRGSVTAQLTCLGTQGHIAYPDLYNNPIPRLLQCLQELTGSPLDEGCPFFEPSRLTVTGIVSECIAENVTPSTAQAFFGVRFNPLHQADKLEEWFQMVCQKYAGQHHLTVRRNGNSFLTQDAEWIECLRGAIRTVLNKDPELTTRGGTTDGRFLSCYAPVLELGMPEGTIHQVNERILLSDIDALEQVYFEVLRRYFKIL
ncbi:MAG: succinyl-diaminopimelate desuccinylase [Alphaproteobacteria bacterium 40-19]|nr:MAG: succinyl-diaminopimelate desuccinylase [Alphaproteobacteria bacterium 40-19]